MAILSQLMDIEEMAKLRPEDLRNLILKLDDQIKSHAKGEKMLVTLQATVLGVKGDRPAGDPEFREKPGKG